MQFTSPTKHLIFNCIHCSLLLRKKRGKMKTTSNQRAGKTKEGSHPHQHRPHFFKVIFFSADRGIKIPTAFIRKCADRLEKVVSLKVPTGALWRVELLQTNDGTWLQKGWQEFAEYYSIKEFHFLVFRYDGNSQFHVVIFDQTASEIEYPVEATMHVRIEDVLGRRTNRLRKLEEIEFDDHDDDDNSIEILEEVPASCQRDTSDPIVQPTFGKSREYVNRPRVRPRIKEKSCEIAGMPRPRSFRARRQTVFKKDKHIAYQRAKAFKSENPFFICFMQPTYVSGPCLLNIPLTFVKTYITKDHYCNLEVRLLEGTKTWTMECNSSIKNGKIVHGWKEFVLENSLVFGDVCVFELVRETKIFNIIIYKKS